MTTTPPFSYFGGKMGMAERITSLMPPHRVYVEPFFGSGAVFFAKPQARYEIINDLDGAVAAFFRVLRDRVDELEEACALTPHSRDEFEAATLDEDLEDLELARRFWVRVNQSFCKTSGPMTGWSVSTSTNRSVPGSILNRIGRFADAAERLMATSIENCDAVELVARMATTDDCVVYADPPYLAETRSNRYGSGGDYRHDAGSIEFHTRLAEVLHETPATVILSGYPSEAYDELYADWERMDVPITLKSSNWKATQRPERVECLWSNRPWMDGRMF